MAKKKAAPKSKVGKDKPTKAKDEAAQLYISQAVWDSVVKNMGQRERSNRTRALFAMANGEDTVYGVKYCRIIIRNKKTTKSDHDTGDEDVREPKLCEEGA